LKISKTIRWILTIGILAILLTGLGVTYARQMAEQRELNANIAQARQDFITYTAQRKELETRLGEAKSSIATLQDKFESPTESIEISTILFETADDANVTITKLSSSLPKEEKLNGIAYQVFTLSVTAGGGVEALLNFVQKLSDKFPSSDITSVNIKVPQEDGEKEPAITLAVKIYAYKGE